MCGASDCTLVGLVLLGAVMASSPAAGQGTVVTPPPLVQQTSAVAAPNLVRPRPGDMAEPRLVKVQAASNPPTGQPGRIAEPDSREQYKMRLQNELRQKEAKLTRQESELAAWQTKIKDTHQALISATNAQATAKPGEDDASSGGDEAVRSPAQLSKDLEAQTYYAMIAREAVMASRRDINNLRGILAQISQVR